MYPPLQAEDIRPHQTLKTQFPVLYPVLSLFTSFPCRQASAAHVMSAEDKQMAKVQVQQISQQLHGLKTRLEVALQHNAALEPDLQLTADELCLNSALRYEQQVVANCFAYEGVLPIKPALSAPFDRTSLHICIACFDQSAGHAFSWSEFVWTVQLHAMPCSCLQCLCGLTV